MTESPYDMIDIQTMPSVRQLGYHPLVSVEIGKKTYDLMTTEALLFFSFTVRETTVSVCGWEQGTPGKAHQCHNYVLLKYLVVSKSGRI